MSSPSAAHLRSLYRSLLRELPPRPILATPRTHIHNRIRSSFSSSATTSSSDDAATTTAVKAQQFVAYLRAQRQYATLVERYNPGMDMTEEERVRLTARRVGMDLPKLHGRD